MNPEAVPAKMFFPVGSKRAVVIGELSSNDMRKILNKIKFNNIPYRSFLVISFIKNCFQQFHTRPLLLSIIAYVCFASSQENQYNLAISGME
jgi:hypothetical protein